MKVTYTLRDIQNRKAEVLSEIRSTKREVNALASEAMRPKIVVPKYLTVNSLRKAYGIYCKARHAYKIASTIASLFRRR